MRYLQPHTRSQVVLRRKPSFLFESRKVFAKEAGMLTRVFLSPTFTQNVKLVFDC